MFFRVRSSFCRFFGAGSRRWVLLLALLGLATRPLLAQPTPAITLSGQVLDARTQRPLSFASVFLANTTYGATTDSTGHFILAGVLPGQYELMSSYLGYQLYTRPLDAQQTTTLAIGLQPSGVQLEEVTVRPTKNNPADFRRFTQQFLGSSAWSRQCRIENPQAVVVLYDKQTQVLTAVAPRGLQVLNPALGYRITFYQFRFKVDYRAGRIEFAAAPAFEALPGSQAPYQLNRYRAYLGSLPHFLRSVRSNRLLAEGFVARRVVAEIDSEPLRQRLALPATQDSLLQVYEPRPGVVARVYKQPLVAAQLCRTEAATGRTWLRFAGTVQVTYQGEQPDASYLAATAAVTSSFRLEGGVGRSLPTQGGALIKNTVYATQAEVSELQLLEREALILPTGYLLNPLAIKVDGYWAFEKIGEALPLDYVPDPVK